ncbi:MAG TPA: DNA ligase-associated DEXH box helicase, partial [Myxococcales bacterium]|nr:DNA ligase-associated DEXH box helicase [Myxococcales bacterium]
MIVDSAQGLYCPAGAFHLDPALPVERAVLTHAHGDHARAGSAAYLCTPESAALLRRRLEGARVETLPFGERRRIGEVTVSLHP